MTLMLYARSLPCLSIIFFQKTDDGVQVRLEDVVVALAVIGAGDEHFGA